MSDVVKDLEQAMTDALEAGKAVDELEARHALELRVAEAALAQATARVNTLVRQEKAQRGSPVDTGGFYQAGAFRGRA